MDQTDLKVKILDRELPLRVSNPDERAAFTEASEIINRKIRGLQAQGHKDKESLMAMAAFATAMELIKAKRGQQRAGEHLDAIDLLLEEALI